MVTQNEPGNTEDQDVITINKKQFARLWKEWQQKEREFYDAIAGLVGELMNRIDRDHCGQAKYAMLDLMFSEAEQHILFM